MAAAAKQQYLAEPRWHARRQLRTMALPPAYRDWLLDPTSLTQRIIRACAGEFRVQLLEQSYQHPLLSESQALGMRYGRTALVRQVMLLCDDLAWVYARTVIPRSTLTGANRRLAYLRSRSLGATLFADPTMQRDEVEICHLTAQDQLFLVASQGLQTSGAAIWGRRSVFRLQHKPLLVSEFFLPTVTDHGL